jgi:hypothetical protein
LIHCQLVKRVNWLRAKARHARWAEEVTIVKNEMVWTHLWFKHQVETWESRQRASKLLMSEGHEIYAAKQVWVWKQFLESATEAFQGRTKLEM